MRNKIKCLSLFSCAGMAETYFKEVGIEVVLANELNKERCNFYKHKSSASSITTYRACWAM